MKKKIKILAIVTSIIMFATFLMACGGGGIIWPSNITTNLTATVGQEFSRNLNYAESSREGDNISYRITGTMPRGLSIDSMGILSGTPAQAGTFTFAVEAYTESRSAAQEFTITIGQGQLAIGTTSIQAFVGSLNNIVLSVSGAGYENPVIFTQDAGSLPYGLNLLPNGTITGTPIQLGQTTTLTVTASSEYVASATATITIEVVEPQLELSIPALPLTREGTPYSMVLPRATFQENAVVGLVYTPATQEDAQLIQNMGLTLRESGLLYTAGNASVTIPAGTPPPFPGRPIQIYVNIRVDAPSCTSTEERFRVDIAPAFLNPDGEELLFATRHLPTAHRLETYSTNTTAANVGHRQIFAAAGNRTVRYFLHGDSVLPQGFELLQSGMLYVDGAVPNALPRAEHEFTVRAEAAGLAEYATATFTLQVEYAFLQFSAAVLEYFIERGTEITHEGIAGAPVYGALRPDSDDTAGITYTVPADVTMPTGLSVSGGRLIGIPDRAYGFTSFVVEASAPGYYSNRGEVFIYIQDALVDTNGVFEAEFVDMFGRSGSGSSGAAHEHAMIQENGDGGITGASNRFFIGWHYWNRPGGTYNPPFTFRIHSTAAVANAQLSVRLAMETGVSPLVLTPANYDVRVNDTQVTGFNFTVSSTSFGNFTLGNISLVEGWNYIQIRVLANNFGFYAGQGAPAFDHVRITSFGSATLTWRPHTYNLLKARGVAEVYWRANAPNFFTPI